MVNILLCKDRLKHKRYIGWE